MNQNDTVATIKKARQNGYKGPMQAYQQSNWGKAIPIAKRPKNSRKTG